LAAGPNRHFDAGDGRFHPDNIIWDSREANIIAITDRKTGNISWRLGPNYDGSEAERKLGWIIGQHHAHIIPRGLPGDGNLLVFDNGGWAGYGKPNPASPTGRMNATRDYSRVLEVDPISLEIVWQYTPAEAGFLIPHASRFYSPFVSSAQRLPNGNTLINEGSDGRIFEVTRNHELVWEYISPYRGSRGLNRGMMNMVYRAYRAPYSWVPQRPAPTETPIPPLERSGFRVPGAAPPGREREISVPGVEADQQDAAFCVAPVR
jgi:Arylsulfotransferase (ASST)